MTLTTWVLSACLAASHDAKPCPVSVADAIAAVSTEAPLFAGPEGARRTAALLVVVAWRESSYRLDVLGDGGKAHGLYQLHELRGAKWESLRTDPLGQTRLARYWLHASMARCPEHPLALYASGKCMRVGVAESRLSEAKRVFAAVPWEEES